VQVLVRVAAAFGTAGDVVQIIDSLNGKRNLAVAFDEGEIAARVVDLRKENNLTVADAGLGHGGGGFEFRQRSSSWAVADGPCLRKAAARARAGWAWH